MNAAVDVMAGVLSSLSSRLETDLAALRGGDLPELMSDRQIAVWQVEALALAGFQIVPAEPAETDSQDGAT